MTGLATLPEASAYKALGGGGGARPTDPSALAARALNAAMGDDRETALKLFDYGVENYGTDFVTAYNGLRDSRELGEASVTPSKPGVLKQVVDSIKVGDGKAPVELPDELPFAKTPDRPPVQGPPWQTNGVELDRATPGSAYRESIIPTPGQPIVVPDAPQIPVVRPDRNEASTLRGQAFRGSATEEAVARGVPLAQVEAERAQETEAARAADAGPPAVPAVPAVPAPPAATPATPPPPLAVVTDNVPGIATPQGGGGLATLRGSTAAGTTEGQQRLDAPDVATKAAPETPPPPTRRYGLQRDGTYVDAPPGDATALPEGTVTVTRKTGLPARTAGDPGSGAGTAGSSVRNVGPPRQRAAAPDSGGLASAVQPPPAAVDTGTNTPAPPAPPAAPAVDTNQAPAADDGGFMGKPDVWSFLTSAGLGAMASGSPDFLGAVGAGGTAGINQLGVLRKEQRERQKNLADARFQEDRIKLGYAGEAGQNSRTDKTIQSNERINEKNNQGQGDRLDKTIGADRERQIKQQEHDRQQTLLQSQLRQTETEFNDRVRDQNIKDDQETKFNFFVSKGHTPEDASRMAGGFAPPTEKTPTFSPMGEKESNTAIEYVAGSMMGAGRTGQELLDKLYKLSPDIASGFKAAIGRGQSPGEAAYLGEQFLKKSGVITKDGSWGFGMFGDDHELHVVPQQTPGPAAGTPGSGNPRYVQGQGIVR